MLKLISASYFRFKIVRYEVLTAMTATFWAAGPCRLAEFHESTRRYIPEDGHL
jgi:hypothetical protein